MNRDTYYSELSPLIEAALQSPGLLPPNEFNLARYSPHPHTRNRLLDPDVLALEDYLIDHAGDMSSPDLVHAFGDVVAAICHDDSVTLQIGYHHMAWLLTWLNTHYLPSFFVDDPDSNLQILQMAAALGIGEWAAANNQIEEGLEKLLAMANGSLWRVQEAGVLGLQRLLRQAWERSMLRLRYQMLIANPAEWRAMIACWCDDAENLLADHPDRTLDILDMLHAALRFIYRDHRAQQQPLIEVLNRAIAAAGQVAPDLVLAQMRVWALWDHAEVKAILRMNLAQLHGGSGDLSELEA